MVNILQFWLGDSMPYHIEKCIESITRFKFDNHLIVVDHHHNIDYGNATVVMLSDIITESELSFINKLDKMGSGWATKVDYLRMSVMERLFPNGNVTYLDIDTLILRDPTDEFTCDGNEIRISSAYPGFCENGSFCVGNDIIPISKVKLSIELYIDKCLSENKKLKLKDLMNLFDSVLLCYFKDRINWRDKYALRAIMYGGFESRLSKGKPLNSKDKSRLKTSIGVHLYRPESMSRLDAKFLDDLVDELYSYKD